MLSIAKGNRSIIKFIEVYGNQNHVDWHIIMYITIVLKKSEGTIYKSMEGTQSFR